MLTIVKVYELPENEEKFISLIIFHSAKMSSQ